MQKQSLVLVLEALLRGDKNITALNQGNYLTTRLPNIITKLRNAHGLKINTIWERNPNSGKKYGRYELLDSSKEKAIKLLKELKAYKRGKSKESLTYKPNSPETNEILSYKTKKETVYSGRFRI